MPIKHREFWNFWWTRWLRHNPEWLTPQSEARRDVPEQIDPNFSPLLRREHWVGKRVVEAGCGVSWIGVAFAHETQRYVGLDISPVALAIMRALVPEGSVFHLLDDLYDRRVVRQESGADTFFAGFVFIHLAWDEAVPMMEMARDLIRPGGVLIATFYKEVDPARFPPQDVRASTPGDSNLVCYGEDDIGRLLERGCFDLAERKEFSYEGNRALNIVATRRPHSGLKGLLSRFRR